LLFFLLFAVLFSTFSSGVHVVKASGEIFIRADGSVEPSTACIATTDNVTYTLTDNVYNGVKIERSNITFNGDGRVIQGSGVGTGVEVGSLEREEFVSGVAVNNLTVRGFERDIYGAGSGLDCGIFILGSGNAVIGCNVTEKIRIAGYYNAVTRCRMTDGLEIIEFGYNNIFDNYVENGIGLHATSANDVFRNRIAYGDIGILGDFASSNNISGNQIFSCRIGIALYPQPADRSGPRDPINNLIVGNEIIYCQDYGISLTAAWGTHVYHNNLISNTKQAQTNSGNWDNGYPSGGNYWSDYNETDADGDGIGDRPYSIDTTNTDNYPLMTRYNSSAFEKLPFNLRAKLSATCKSGTHGVEFEFDASSSIPGWNGSQLTIIERYDWTFGDGSTASTALPKTVHAYMSAGPFEATVTVTDNVGMNGQSSQRISVWMETTLTVSTIPASTSIGLTIKISGVLQDFYRRGLQDQTVICYYTSPGLGWVPIVSDSTDQNGLYEIEWMPSATGSYTVMADFEGSSLYVRSESYVTLNILSSENRYLFSVESNSTISELLFNSTTRELSFKVTGSQGSSGYTNVMMAKDPEGTNFDIRVYIDGEQLDHTSTSLDGCWKISFSYPHSTHRIVVALHLVSTSFFETLFGRASILLISVIAIVTIILLIIIRKKSNTRSRAVSKKSS
jgi:parallel beta-helix repeat protein